MTYSLLRDSVVAFGISSKHSSETIAGFLYSLITPELAFIVKAVLSLIKLMHTDWKCIDMNFNVISM